MTFEPARFCIPPTASLRAAVATIDKNERGIAIVTDPAGKVLGTVVDGDIRRAMLSGIDLDAPVQAVLDRKAGSRYATPTTAPAGAAPAELLAIMKAHSVRQVPLVDETGRVVDLATLDELAPQPVRVQAVVMAGGFGTRLRPLTDTLPKPMLPVGDRPILERIIEQLRAAGIRRVNVTTHYKAERIVEHFGTGERFGVDIQYVNERTPLGTAGALTLIERPSDPVLVVNGDILTDLNYRSLLAYHEDQKADMTVGVHRYEFRVPYGVVEAEPDGALRSLNEKPLLRFFVNAGIYLLEPRIYGFLEDGRKQDMPELIARLMVEGRRVVTFPLRESWIDIGQLDDYARAQAAVKTPTAGSS